MTLTIVSELDGNLDADVDDRDTDMLPLARAARDLKLATHFVDGRLTAERALQLPKADSSWALWPSTDR